MNRRVISLVAASALAVATIGGSAAGAELKANQAGFSCPAGLFPLFHFLNNQVPKETGVGRYTVRMEASGFGNVLVVTISGLVPATGKKVRRFDNPIGGVAFHSHTLISASTDLPGHLVLASAQCVAVG